MSSLEHYFENLLFDGHDVADNCNKDSLSTAEQKAVEECADYVIYSLFYGREDFLKWVNRT